MIGFIVSYWWLWFVCSLVAGVVSFFLIALFKYEQEKLLPSNWIIAYFLGFPMAAVSAALSSLGVITLITALARYILK